MIAPFFADVDTRDPGTGTVHYGATAVGGAKAFCVLWDNVGYYNTHANRLNTFQLLLVERPDQASGDFDLVVNYDRLDWETGDADSGVDGLGGLAAEAGFTNADQHFSLLGSQQSGAFLDTNPAGLVHGSFNAAGFPGRYVFRVRAGDPGLGNAVSGQVRAADGTVVPDTLLQLCPVGGGGQACLTTNSRSDGSYSFVDVADGTWNLVAFPPASAGAAGGSLQGIQVAGTAVSGADLTVPDGPPAPVPANGSVQTAAGDPIGGATVTVLAASTPAGPFLPVPDGSSVLAPGARANPTVTDAGGAFAFAAIAGLYKVQAQKEGCFAAGDQTMSYAESPLVSLPPDPVALVLRLDCPTAQQDTTPPVIDVPATINAEAVSAAGAAVPFTVSATDAVDGSVPVSCDRTPGATFPIGTTAVHCSASDAAGNTAHAQFDVVVVDTTPPLLDLPGTINVQAATAAGAAVSFSVSAADLVDGPVPVTCDRASEATFPVGTTTVHCSASDTAGNTTHGQFDVVVTPAPADTTPPVLKTPTPIHVDATSPAGAVVTYHATALDAVDGPLPVSCDRASGATFPIGTTTVRCSAQDAAGNHASAAFAVHVAGAGEQLEALLADVESRRIGPGSSLVGKLRDALASLRRGDQAATRLTLAATRRETAAQAGKKLTAAQAAWLIGELTRIERVLAG